VTEANYRQLAPVYAPVLAGLRPLRGNVLASSYAFAHHVRCTGKHVVFCHSPLRQIWSGIDDYRQRVSLRTGLALRAVTPFLRFLDRRAALRAHLYIATSSVVHSRLNRYYGLSATPIIPPPIDTVAFRPDASPSERDYYLWAGRIVEPYKRLSLVVEAFAKVGARLLVAGSGRDEQHLRAIAPSNVTFLGEVPTPQLAELYRSARALIFPSTDDFGMVPLESMASGTPVIAHRSGGALDTIVEGVTGTFFDSASPESLVAAIDRFEAHTWDTERIVAHANEFSEPRFIERLDHVLSAA
jgi:glycosyltransferase involved in cell wall biosynthesis